MLQTPTKKVVEMSESTASVAQVALTPEAEQAVRRCLALIDVHRPRNGRRSAENVHSDKLKSVVETFFGVKSANVNDMIHDDPQIRAHLGIQ